MAKYKSGNYLQLSREIFKNPMPFEAIGLYSLLVELEHKYTGTDCNFFYTTEQQLANMLISSRKRVRKFKKLLIELGFIQTWKMNWVNADGSKSEKHVTAVRILK